MNAGTIPIGRDRRGIDLHATLESAQTFLWRRTDGNTYHGVRPSDESVWYATVADGEVILVRQTDGYLAWRSTIDATALLRRRLRLDDDLDSIFASVPDDRPLSTAREAHPGLRVVRDPFFPCLIAFICSARTRVRRIFEFQAALAREFGDAREVEGVTYRAFPGPDQLADATEADLRDLGLGFRAPYVVETTAMVAGGEVTEADLRGKSYAAAHDALQQSPGVGPKVADCVALFALGHLEAVPVDTWTRRLIERCYPELAASSYDATATAFRERFGEYAGYAQTYLYHHERSRAE